MQVPRFHFADTSDPDMFYLVRSAISDPFFYVDTGESRYVFLNALEIGAFEEHNKNPTLIAEPIEPLIQKAKEMQGSESSASKIARALFERFGFYEMVVEVSTHLPLDMADVLRENGAKLLIKRPFLPERSKKRSEEIESVRESMRITCEAFQKIESILSDSKFSGEVLQYKNETLTSEYVRDVIELFFFEKGMECTAGLIVSCGAHSAMPHHRGIGPIRPNQAIICDLFPRNRKSGYFADMTRTYVKGEPSERLHAMYDAVYASYLASLKAVRPGASTKDAYDVSAKIIKEKGFDVGEKGYIHSLGHGVGLSIHEAPSLSNFSKENLEIGNIITIEPGLYYPQWGGVRYEDTIVVTESGFENLTNFENDWIIS